MRNLITIIILVLGMSVTAYSQSYDKPPELVFLEASDGITTILLSNYGKDKLSYGDTITVKQRKSDAYEYVYDKDEIVDLTNSYEQIYVPKDSYKKLAAGGIDYIKINNTYYWYTSKQRRLQRKQFKLLLKNI